jgi:hypothetical protein
MSILQILATSLNSLLNIDRAGVLLVDTDYEQVIRSLLALEHSNSPGEEAQFGKEMWHHCPAEVSDYLCGLGISPALGL